MQPFPKFLRYGGKVTKNLKKMMKTLKVIKDFDQQSVGDIYELAEDGKSYICESVEDNSYVDARTGSTVSSKNSYKSEISEAYAQRLIDLGYLAPENEKKDQKEYKNVFSEITDLRDSYIEDLKNLEKNYSDQPACMKVEAETVLSNLVKLCDHLLKLKK